MENYFQENTEAERISNGLKNQGYKKIVPKENESESLHQIRHDEEPENFTHIAGIEEEETLEELTRGQGHRLNVP